MEGEGCAEASNAAARQAADAPARRGGGVKGHSAAAGLAGGGGRERSAPCARVQKRRHQCGGGRGSRPPLETQGRAPLSWPPSPAQLPALGGEAGL